MAKIYAAPEEIQIPELDFKEFGNYEKECEDYIQKLKDFCLENSDEKEVGEIIKFPMGDGHAEYMICSMKPLELIHIPLMDAWSFPYAHLLTVKEVEENIAQRKAMEKLFSENK